MTTVAFTYIQPDGTEKRVEVAEDSTLMEAALMNGIDPIQGLCGGICSCATCHVVLDAESYARVPPPDEEESEMIGMLDNAETTSRLGCQVRVTEALQNAEIRALGSE